MEYNKKQVLHSLLLNCRFERDKSICDDHFKAVASNGHPQPPPKGEATADSHTQGSTIELGTLAPALDFTRLAASALE